MVFLLCTFSHDISGRSDWQRSHRTSCRLFSCVYLYVTFQNISSYILQAKGFSPVSIFSWHFWSVWLKKVSLHIPHTNGFSPVHIFSWCFWSVRLTDLVAHPAGFFPVCLITWHFIIFHRTSCRQRAFLLLCVSSCDISECLVAHPAGKWLFSFVYLRLIFQNV